MYLCISLTLKGRGIFVSGKASANGSVPKEKGAKTEEHSTAGGDSLPKEFLIISQDVRKHRNREIKQSSG